MLGCTSYDPNKTGVPEKSCRKAAALLKEQDRKDDLRRSLSTLCFTYRDDKACKDMKKLAPARPGPPPPPLPPTAKR
jgi:hypothetical protein